MPGKRKGQAYGQTKHQIRMARIERWNHRSPLQVGETEGIVPVIVDEVKQKQPPRRLAGVGVAWSSRSRRRTYLLRGHDL